MSRPALPSSERLSWRRLSGRLLDLLYPSECALCRCPLRDDHSLCDACDAELPRLREPFCGACGEPFDGAIDGTFQCPNCSQLKFSFEFARPALPRNESLRDLIHRLKYGRQVHLAPQLGRLAHSAFDDPRLAIALAEKWPLIPVPLHRSRLRFRHFNQAAEIARPLSQLTGLPVVRALARIRRTDTQTSLSRAQRLQNLRGSFALSRAGRALATSKPRGAVLVDDVLTTGSTVDACAKVLRKAGVPRVAVVTVMRG